MRLSIVTINYNNINGLKDTLNSVLFQTFCDYEHIIIDGASSDGSIGVIDKYKEASGRKIVVVSEQDSGIYNAMNKGIALACGERILFLNSGDFLIDSMVLESVFNSNVDDYDVVYGNLRIRNNDKTYCDKKFPPKLSLEFMTNDSLPHPSTFYKKQIFEIFKYDESYRIVSDWLLNWQLFFHGYSFNHIDVLVTEYNLEGISSKETDLCLKETIDALSTHTPSYLLNIINERKDFKEKYEYLNQRATLRLCVRAFLFHTNLLNRILSKLEKLS